MPEEVPVKNSGSGPEGIKPSGEDDIFNLLNTDLIGSEDKGKDDEKEEDKGGEEKKEIKSEDKKDDFEEDERDEEDEDFNIEETEDEDEEGKEDDFSEEDGADVYYRSLKKQYPDIFKKVPQLKAVIGQHRAYRSLFSTVQEAREVANKSEVFDFLDARINSGDAAPLFNALHTNDKTNKTNVLNNLAEKLLPTLYDVSPTAFRTATQPLLISILTRAKEQAISTGNKVLAAAADVMAENIFGSKKLPDISNRTDPSLDAKKEELDNRERNLAQQEYHRHAVELATRADKTLTKAIERRIDPEEALSSFDREAKVNQAMSELEHALNTDQDHMSKMENMRKRLIKSRFSDEEKARWVSTYLASAKSVIGPILRRAGAVKKSDEKEGKVRSDGRKAIPSGSKTGPTFKAGKLPPVAELRKKGVSVLDVLRATAGDS